MKVYFIGAGPGASDLITLRGANILGRVSMVLYAGSLVPTDMLQHCRPDAELIDTAKLDLEQQEACYRRAQEAGCDVARLHSGDPAIYGATAEQMRRLDALGIDYEIVPGVSSFTSAAASIKAELTKPEVSQTVILTRVSGRASAVPELESIARSGRTPSDDVHLPVRAAFEKNSRRPAPALPGRHAGGAGLSGNLAGRAVLPGHIGHHT